MLFINFHAGIDGKTSQTLMGVLAEQVNKGEKEVCLMLSSAGGATNSGITLFNYIKSLPIKTIMFNIGIVDSIANVVFLAGAERYAVPNSSFLFHGVGLNITQQARFEEKQIKESLLSIERDQNLITDIIVANSKLDLNRVKDMFLEAKTLTPEEAKTVNIIKDVKPLVIPEGAKILSLIFQ
jgi:ATP-dependent Clp protease protease subunit